MLFPSVPGRESFNTERKGLERGLRQPRSRGRLGEVAPGAASSPRQAKATRVKEQAGCD